MAAPGAQAISACRTAAMRTIPLQQTCAVCGKLVPVHDLTPAELVRPPIVDLIRRECASWTPESWLCHSCQHRFTALLVEDMLAEERGEISQLDQEVLASMRDNELIASNLNVEIAEQRTLADRLADHIAGFGGSWRFVLLFVFFMLGWIAFNSVVYFRPGFDPYPYILLNLLLSCVAALQAPIIMMSQNRQEQRDRLRAEQDYKVNLKAELEVRLLMTKLDQLRNHQWQHLLEFQRIQTDLMEEILRQKETAETNKNGARAS